MSDFTPSRRRFLAGGVAAAVAATAGCRGAASTDSDGDRALRLTLHRHDGPLRDRFVVDLEETGPDWDEEAFEAALDGREYTTRFRRPFNSSDEDPKYAERDGTYYRLDSVVVGETTATLPVLRLFEAESDDGSTPARDDAVDASQLPAVDQAAVRTAHFAARARGNEGGVPSGLVRRGGFVYWTEERADESELLADDGPDRVVYRDTVYAVEISQEEFREPVYRATVEPVAETPERMEAIVRAQFVDAYVDRETLSTEAVDIMLSARGDGYAETHPFSSGYEEVLRAMHERVYLDGNVEKDAGVDESGRRLIRYDGAYYDYSLRFESAADAE